MNIAATNNGVIKRFLVLVIISGAMMIAPMDTIKAQGFDQVEIQAQDDSGNWRTYTITQNNSQLILQNMKQLRWQFPDKRIRAIDQNGRVVDIY